MKLITIFFCLLTVYTEAQKNIDTIIESKFLLEKRPISIHLPKSYEKSMDKVFPVIYSLDGEYTNYVINGTVDFYSYLDKIPECIVVSINQNYSDSTSSKFKRWTDCFYDWKTGLPLNRSILFKKFISDELISYIDKNYRTTNFKAIIGHSFTANFINYFLLDEAPVFQGYCAISPYYADNSIDSIKSIVTTIQKPTFYFVSCGERDLSGHIESVTNFNEKFSKLRNSNFIFKKFNSKNNFANHFTILPASIPAAIEHIFSLYSPIPQEEFKTLLKSQNKITYLKEKYKQIENIYGIKIKLREDDINVAAYAVSKNKKWNELKELGELAVFLYPESYSGYWILGEFAEKIKNNEAALNYYQTGFKYLGADILNISDFQNDIDRVKKKLTQ